MMLKAQAKVKSSAVQIPEVFKRGISVPLTNAESWVYYSYFQHLALQLLVPTSSLQKILGNPTSLFILGCSMILFSPYGWTSAHQTSPPISKLQPNQYQTQKQRESQFFLMRIVLVRRLLYKQL